MGKKLQKKRISQNHSHRRPRETIWDFQKSFLESRFSSLRETHCFELIQSYVKAGERVRHSRSSEHNWWSTQLWAIVPIACAFTTTAVCGKAEEKWVVKRRSGQSKAKPGVKTIWSAVWGTRGKTPPESLPSLLVTWLQGWPLAR